MNLKNKKIGIIGLGYVGLPLAVEFGKKRDVIGFDINVSRVDELKNGIDSTFEILNDELQEAVNLSFTSKLDNVKNCEIFIVTVPTPIDTKKQPDLLPLEKSSESIGSILKKGDIVIYESTVYPGATEEKCVPILEKMSGLVFNKDFYCGYSPERINPGDKERPLNSIKKITSGSTPEIAIEIDELYKEIIIAGTHLASSIKVAEAAKVIENTQRDVNIALINEFASIFNKLDIDTESVLKAAGTKWNFLPFKPGLVGGHCIGVDPYYLAHKALEVGYNPEMILLSRKLNDNMSVFIVNEVITLMTNKHIQIAGSNILVLGLTFKENCHDLRNTRVVDLVEEFKKLKCDVDVYDPWADKHEAVSKYNIDPIDQPQKNKYDAVVIAVAHKEFKKLSIDLLKSYCKDNSVIYDIKHILDFNEADGRL